MRYFSTNKLSPAADFKEAALLGQAPDRGLYFPEKIPKIDFSRSFSKTETAFEIIRHYAGEAIPDEKLYKICRETVDFDFPLVRITDDIYSLELFHGPTLAFKDVGARFMSRCLGYFSQDSDQKIVVIVATSGDTGGAVADGFYGVEGVEVVILYPSGKVSNIQELQLTTHGKNITALEIDGNFDDCQNLAKQSLADSDIKEKLFLTSANSINIARWLPQQFYYAFAWQQWKEEGPPAVCVPSGNFGNIAAGLLIKASGLPLGDFLAACNENDAVCRYLENGRYEPLKAIQTLSNAMDVGDPSNFVRLLEIFGHDFETLKAGLKGVKFSDEETAGAIKETYAKHNYLLDPHGAIGYRGLQKLLAPGEKGIFLETAHPIKFDPIPGTAREAAPPESIRKLLGKEKKSIKLGADYERVKEIILALK